MMNVFSCCWGCTFPYMCRAPFHQKTKRAALECWIIYILIFWVNKWTQDIFIPSRGYSMGIHKWNVALLVLCSIEQQQPWHHSKKWTQKEKQTKIACSMQRSKARPLKNLRSSATSRPFISIVIHQRNIQFDYLCSW